MDPIRRCVQALSRLPGIGEKTAWRLTWWLLRTDDSVVTEIAAAVGGLQGSVVECARCLHHRNHQPLQDLLRHPTRPKHRVRGRAATGHPGHRKQRRVPRVVPRPCTAPFPPWMALAQTSCVFGPCWPTSQMCRRSSWPPTLMWKATPLRSTCTECSNPWASRSAAWPTA